jgi:superfamily I DNA and/or RNA helicase
MMGPSLMQERLVAMTRPKRSLTVIGDSETVQR